MERNGSAKTFGKMGHFSPELSCVLTSGMRKDKNAETGEVNPRDKRETVYGEMS